MKGDFSKYEFNPWDNHQGVLHQQGRVLLDQDWNAAQQIGAYLRQVQGRDAFGASLAAVPVEHRDGFKVSQATLSPSGVAEITLSPGRVWVDGLALQVQGSAPYQRKATYLGPPIQDPAAGAGTVQAGVRDAVILEVWEEGLHGFQDPPNLIEAALGGVDTTERVKLCHRLRLFRLGEDDDCGMLRERLADAFASKGTLRVTPAPTQAINGDCPVALGGGYTGFEHYLYRIEIAAPNGDGDARFKWSRFNGGLVGRGTYDSVGQVVDISANDQMINHCGLTSFWLEALRKDPDADAWVVAFSANATLSANNKLTLSNIESLTGWPGDGAGEAFFRLWDDIALIGDYAKGSTSPVLLRDGLMIELDAPAISERYYAQGDYWTFPVRAGGVYYDPSDWPDADPPQGVVHHRVPLAILCWSGPPTNTISFDAGEILDCRHVFQPLADLSSCCTFSVGDGISTNGQFNSLEEALRHLPSTGGRLCLLPGVHRANLLLDGRSNVRISGCGGLTLVQPTTGHADGPILELRNCVDVCIDELTLLAPEGSAIVLADAKDVANASHRITIARNHIVACVHAIDLRVRNEDAGNNAIRIEDNRIGMLDKANGGVAVFVAADDVLIEDNRIVVVPAPGGGDPDDPRPQDDPSGGWYEPCPEPQQTPNSWQAYPWVAAFFGYIDQVIDPEPIAYSAQGGIQIGGGSEQVRIIANTIIGGWGHGITLGDMPGIDDLYDGVPPYLAAAMDYFDPKDPYIDQIGDEDLLSRLEDGLNAYLYAIEIADNRIRNMGMSGISAVVFTDLAKVGLLVHAEDLRIRRNEIIGCVQQIPEVRPQGMPDRYGFGGIALASCEGVLIAENRIERNGRSQLEPICGVLILYGEKIDISGNRILDNGPRTFAGDAKAIAGLRGGIVIQMALKEVLTSLFQGEEGVISDGIPAVRIHDNVVTQPLGQALAVLALGPVSVVGNQLTSQGADYRADPFSLLAGAVLILNLGVSKDLLAVLALTGFKRLAAVNAKSLQPISGEMNADLAAFLRLLFYLPDGRTLFANNQVKLDLRDLAVNFTLSSQLIASLDDLSYLGNQSEVASVFLPGYSLDLVLTDAALFGVTLRSSDNRFQEGFTVALNSLFSYGLLNSAVGNQATHCMNVYGAKRVYAGNLVAFDAQCPQGYIEIGNALFLPTDKLDEASA